MTTLIKLINTCDVKPKRSEFNDSNKSRGSFTRKEKSVKTFV